MTRSSEFPEFVRMLKVFVEGKGVSRGTTFVREIEGEFTRLGLDDEEEFSDLQHALAMYRGREEDIQELRNEAIFATRRLTARSVEPDSIQTRNEDEA